jgi:drug/metabolite transporter (DMT)-like permease
MTRAARGSSETKALDNSTGNEHDSLVKRLAALVLLLATTFSWGVTFSVVKEAVARVDVFVFLGQRFLAAFVLLAAVAAVAGGRLDPTALRGGAAMGTVLFLAYALQTVALQHTSASNAAFLTGVSVVLVPLFGAALFRERIGRALWAAAGLAAVGLSLLTTNGVWAFRAGDALAALCAVCIAFHLLLTGRYAGRGDLWWLTATQIGVVALGSAAVALATGQELFVWHPFLLWPLVVCVLFATVLAFLVQTWVQRSLSASHTALIFCLEPVFAALWAAFALGERLGPVGYAGAVLILAAMVVAGRPAAPDARCVPRAR